VTLAQIILENERSGRAALPTAFLHQLIKHGQAWQDFFQRSLQASLEGIISSQREADRIFKEWAGRAGLVSSAPQTGLEEKTREPASEAETLRNELETLKEKLRTLERRMERKEEG
jgi:polyhydroxyalkanoate synthesis regulator protein